ncbi:MAG: LytTR family DNA-binding domain-containing protein [Hydrogenophaga sp.]|uniref:LytR/AlgR family response regulator transcription factor n=1 Tax=Hydrogenophaga sp. TaxID=1904254 RepID=UPI002756EF95|nr:LytTR family DNA-binding domain-containing protein [Hydrogenophaga sp.]MDP2418917.1 LytTR family DNA-binding domain-containing protein [Hydrogenophaga sp.]MDZ4188144.1 LytTR family DNA-binding domain-containing protein [Hydrogenophaga sp.]
MNPTALIAEDEPLLAAALQAELARAWPELRVCAVVGDGASAVRQALIHRPAVLFLDIRMPGLSGLEAAAELADAWPQGADAPPFPATVFVTAYDQYAVQAFEAQAVDYLLKPVQPERLARTVRRLQHTLDQRSPASGSAPLEHTLNQLRALLAPAAQAQPSEPLTVIQASVGNTLRLVPVGDVLVFEAADKYVRVLTAAEELLIRTPLKDLLPRLDPNTFWQIHRGTVVQASAIHTVTRNEAGQLHLSLRGRSETQAVSRLYAALFKAM